MSVAPGRSVAGYEIIRPIGKGGMGEIWLARQISIGREVALKILSPKLVERDPRFAERFIAEAQAAGRLNHPSIIAVHDVGRCRNEGGEVHYFSMEFVDGQNFRQLLDDAGPIDEDLIGRVMTAMSDALSYAHGLNMIHRDIKPENIMLTNDGRIKLADFGLAMQVDDDSQEVERDAAGRVKVMGTPLYMSPEQARGVSLDFRSDQYSLGATLYSLLTGQFPYRRDNAREVMRAHVRDPVPDPREVCDCSEPWRRLCMRLMAKRPDDRFNDPLELQQAVAACIAGAWPVPRRRSRAMASADAAPASRLKLVVGGIVLLAVAVVVGAVLLLGSDDRVDSGDPRRGGTASGREQELILEAAGTFLAGLPSEPGEALAVLEGSTGLGNPYLARNPEAMALLQDRATKIRELIAAKAEVAARELRSRLDGIAAAIEQGRLVKAREFLAALAPEHLQRAGEEVAELRSRLAAIETAIADEAEDAIGGAVTTQSVDEAIATARNAELDGERLTALERLATTARQRIEADRLAAVQAQRAADQRTWEKIAQLLRTTRSADHRGDALRRFLAELAKAKDELFASERKDQVARLSTLAEQALALEAALAERLPSRPVRVIRERDGERIAFEAIGVAATGIVLQRPDSTAGTITMPWTDSGLQPTPVVAAGAESLDCEDPSRAIALFSWLWSCPRGSELIAGLGRDDSDARMLASLDPALAEALLTIAWHHDFAVADATSPFAGEAQQVVDGVLRWQPRMRLAFTALDVKQGRQALLRQHLSGLRWDLGPIRNGELHLDLQRLHHLTLVVGLERDGRAAHLVVNHHRGREEAGLFSSAGDGVLQQVAYRALPGALAKRTRIRLAIDEQGRVTAWCGDIAIPGELSLPDRGELSVRLDALVFAPPQGFEPSEGVLDLAAAAFHGRLPLEP